MVRQQSSRWLKFNTTAWKYVLHSYFVSYLHIEPTNNYRGILHVNWFIKYSLRVEYLYPGLSQAWKDWFDTEVPEESPIPDYDGATLDTFHKLLLIRSWCPDRTIPMAKVYVAEVMGKQVCVLKCWPANNSWILRKDCKWIDQSFRILAQQVAWFDKIWPLMDEEWLETVSD